MKRQVVVSLLTSKQDFQLMQAEAACEAAGSAGLGVEVIFAENDAVTQIQQLFKLVAAPEAECPLAIVVETVAGESFERVARNAVRAGIGWALMCASSSAWPSTETAGECRWTGTDFRAARRPGCPLRTPCTAWSLLTGATRDRNTALLSFPWTVMSAPGAEDRARRGPA
jgi:hypothetical protein